MNLFKSEDGTNRPPPTDNCRACLLDRLHAPYVYKFFRAHRIPPNGIRRNSLAFANSGVCNGSGSRVYDIYSAAFASRGLLSDADFTELGPLSRQDGFINTGRKILGTAFTIIFQTFAALPQPSAVLSDGMMTRWYVSPCNDYYILAYCLAQR